MSATASAATTSISDETVKTAAMSAEDYAAIPRKPISGFLSIIRNRIPKPQPQPPPTMSATAPVSRRLRRLRLFGPSTQDWKKYLSDSSQDPEKLHPYWKHLYGGAFHRALDAYGRFFVDQSAFSKYRLSTEGWIAFFKKNIEMYEALLKGEKLARTTKRFKLTEYQKILIQDAIYAAEEAINILEFYPF
jgi:hypothetical protein